MNKEGQVQRKLAKIVDNQNVDAFLVRCRSESLAKVRALTRKEMEKRERKNQMVKNVGNTRVASGVYGRSRGCNKPAQT